MQNGERSWYSRRTVGLLAILLVLALVLLAMGHAPWSENGPPKIWYGIAQGPENSQHLFDWYSLTHIVHGFVLYCGLFLVARKLPKDVRFLIAAGAEAAWELIENTDFVIQRYRGGTMSLHYYGDSVLNSIGDVLATVVGYLAAGFLPVSLTVAAAVGLELGLAYAIRDNLTLNIVMLVWPLDSVRKWQMHQ